MLYYGTKKPLLLNAACKVLNHPVVQVEDWWRDHLVTLDVVCLSPCHCVEDGLVLQRSPCYVDAACLDDAEWVFWSPDPGYWWYQVLSGQATVFLGYSHRSVWPARYHLKFHLYLS